MQGIGHHWKPVLLVLLIIGGLILQQLELVELDELLKTMRSYADDHWLILLLILYQLVLFMFALPGSTALWLVAPIYAPLLATIILTVGSTLGGIAAYYLSRHLGENWQQRIRQNRIFHKLEKEGDMLSLLGLRILPGFPHSVINYTAGMLRLPLWQFILTTMVGLTVKNIIYCTIIYHAVSVGTSSAQLELYDVIPLLILTLFIALVRLYLHYTRKNRP